MCSDRQTDVWNDTKAEVWEKLFTYLKFWSKLNQNGLKTSALTWRILRYIKLLNPPRNIKVVELGTGHMFGQTDRCSNRHTHSEMFGQTH